MDELTLSRAILNEAMAGGFLDQWPESNEEIIAEAKYFARHAQKEYNEGGGKNNDTIVAIVRLSEESTNSPSQAQPESGVGFGSSAFSRNYEEDIEMPFDLTDLDDKELRRFHGIFAHYYGKARFQLAEETVKLAAAEHLRDDAFRKAFLKEKQRENHTTVKSIELAAMEDSEYISWNRNVLEHQKNVLKLKALAEIYLKNVEVLSREATIRQNEYERGR